MVVAGKENVTLKGQQIIVERLDTLKVEVVGGRVEHQTVGILQLHARDHATHFLTTR